MYRLPSPFHNKLSHQSPSAAGGGSTCTTCSCCVVTLGLSTLATATHFALLPTPEDEKAGPDYALSPATPAPVASAPRSGKKGLLQNRVVLALMGLFALPSLMVVWFALFMGMIGLNDIGIASGWLLVVAPLLCCGLWVLGFVLVYQNNGRTNAAGVGAALRGMVAIGIVGFVAAGGPPLWRLGARGECAATTSQRRARHRQRGRAPRGHECLADRFRCCRSLA
jgi:hypothetical protein